ncbi:MAG TPA: hypothetical protein VJ983_05835, partial [candidate division Zixibacteria bacterium]|nr:hypothetical protein [candidate division Zixibacteria bacterium]
MRLSRFLAATFVLCWGVLCLYSSPRAADSKQLRQAFEQIGNAKLDTSTTLDLHHFILSHKDLKVQVDSGRIAF